MDDYLVVSWDEVLKLDEERIVFPVLETGLAVKRLELLDGVVVYGNVGIIWEKHKKLSGVL